MQSCSARILRCDPCLPGKKPRAEARGHREVGRARSPWGAGRRGTRSPPAAAGGFLIKCRAEQDCHPGFRSLGPTCAGGSASAWASCLRWSATPAERHGQLLASRRLGTALIHPSSALGPRAAGAAATHRRRGLAPGSKKLGPRQSLAPPSRRGRRRCRDRWRGCRRTTRSRSS